MGFNHALKFKCAGDCVRPIDVSVRVMYLILMCTILCSITSVVLLSVFVIFRWKCAS